MYTVGLLAFEGADLLDTGGPYEVLLTASRLAARAGDDPPFEVVMVAPRPGTYAAYGGMRLQVDEAVAALARRVRRPRPDRPRGGGR